MATIAAHEPIGGMAGVFSGPLHTQAPLHMGPLPPRMLAPAEQLQPNQPFYAPTVQPFFPYQWPTSSLYMPYSGFHGLGYGMMPLLLPPSIEVPGYMTPHAQLHMLDYRRMPPHVAPVTAHQTRRSNFQNGVPFGRVMVSSEVQTEPLCHSVDSHRPAATSDTESGRDTGCDSPETTIPRSTDNKSIACPEGMSVLTQNYNTIATETTDLSTAPKSTILQADRMQIKCGVIPSSFKNIQKRKNMELASYNETDLLQCSLGSVQSSEDVVVCSYRKLAFREDKQSVKAGMLRYSSKRHLSSCTELNVLRTPSCSTFKMHPKPSRSVVNQSVKAKKNSETLFQTKGKEDVKSPTNVHFKILRLPFDVHNHNQPCQVDASVWSVESLLPYMPSSEWLAKNGLITPQKTPSSQTEPSNVISKPNCVPVGKSLQKGTSAKHCDLPSHLDASIWSVESLMPYVPSSQRMVDSGFLTPQKGPQIKSGVVLSELNQSSTDRMNLQTYPSTKHCGVSRQLEASLWSVESLMPYVPSNKQMVENAFITSQKALSPQIQSSNVVSELNRSSGDWFPVGNTLQTCLSNKYEDTFNSLETRSPYRPSTSWLADFGNVYYCSKLPAVSQQSVVLERWQPNVSIATSLKSSPLINVKKTRNQTPATGISDQKHCFSQKCKCKAKSNQRLVGSDMGCNWVSPSTMGSKLPLCPSCRFDTKGKDHSTSGSLGCKRDLANVKSFDKMHDEGILDARKMELGNILPERCAAYQAQLREQSGLCEDYPCLHASPVQDKCDDLGWKIWEKSEDNLIKNQNKRMLQSLQKDSAVKASMQASNFARRIEKKEGCSQAITLEGDGFMAVHSQCAHTLDSVKRH